MKTSLNTFFIIALYSSITTGLAQDSSCSLDKFRCQNGDCIQSDLLCDGRADCTDQSDETRAECTKPEIMCPAYAFRCAYGACVDGDALCNGIKDCIDNSDEALPSCRGASRNESTASSTGCPGNLFKCDNGQCIDNIVLCDGTADCTDKSDETLSKCESIECPPLVFRCAYGACIDGDLKCNGVNNCADGSDEDVKLCRETSTSSTPEIRPVTPTHFTPPSSGPFTPSPWTPKPRGPCTVPPQPQNGHWKLHRSQCASGQDCDLQQGSQLDPGAYLIYTCDPGYKVRGSTDVFCGPEGKWLNIPVCVEIRCKALSSASTDAFCTYNDEWVSCESPVSPRTTAKLTCRNSYRQDTTLLTRKRANVRCNEKGQWDPEPIRCVPVCGVPAPSTTPLIVNGTRAQITEFPWHATLYRAESPEAPKEFICGATIIQEDLLVTAAHCVYNEVTKRVDSASKFFVATGNIFKDFDSPFHDARAVKKGKVENIYIICSYLGLEGNYAWDIAVLKLQEAFVFSSLLVPICLDTSIYSDQAVLEVGNSGRVAGFGRTHLGPSSYVLQSITVPYIPLTQCKSSSVVYETEKFITIDKFCAGYSNGSSVCDGDSGGGLVFKSGGLWYLRGIVSVGLGATISEGTRTCDSHAYSLYTRVSNHMAWIQDVILKLETYKSYPSCPTGK